jgi:glycosyltransferase involved in cell wall biosynthesis
LVSSVRLKFSIVIPCYNDRTNVAALLASLRLPGDGWELLVVDDCSPEGPPELLETLPARVIRLDRQSGPAAARNRGVRESDGDILVFCDADIVLAPDALARLRTYFEDQGERAVIASGLLVPHNPGFFPRYKYFQEMVWVRAHVDHYTNHFSTRFGAIRKDVFGETGGFDETITTAGVEDFEFGYRMRALTRSRLAPDVAFSHRHPRFAKQARLYFTRTADYVELMHRMRLASGDVTTIGATNAEAATALLAFASQVLLVSSLVVPAALLVFAGVTVVYLARIRGLIALMFEREGALFAVRGLLAHYALCTVIVLGALHGKLRCLRRQ